MKVFYTEKHRLRNATTELSGGKLIVPFECPERLDFILAALERRRAQSRFRLEWATPREVTRSELEAVHSRDYLEFLERCWSDWQRAGFTGEVLPNVWPSRSMPSQRMPSQIEGKVGFFALSGETAITATTYEAALASASLAVSGADALLAGERGAVALCRPPGHHAARDQFGGYCFLNNAAIAAEHWIRSRAKTEAAPRLAILDVDFHHGNGTQQIFYDRADVLFCSIHGDPLEAYPHFLGFEDERGVGAGVGANLNCPLPRGASYAQWLEAFSRCEEAIRQHRAEALVVSLGVDTFEEDPISFFKLKSPDYLDLGQRLARLGLPTLLVLEGGYAVEAIGENVVNVLAGFQQPE